MIVWMIGMSGAGKTTIGKELHRQWKERDPAIVLIDGDEIREVFKHDRSSDAYTINGRRINADRITELCLWLDRQNINVACCILSIFPEMQKKNREQFSEYREVFIDVPFEILKLRDYKGLYAAALEGKMKNVVGVDIPFTPPPNPDIVIDNSKEGSDPSAQAKEILNALERV